MISLNFVPFAFVADSRKLQGDALVAFCDEKGVTVEVLLSWRDLALSGIEVAGSAEWTGFDMQGARQKGRR